MLLVTDGEKKERKMNEWWSSWSKEVHRNHERTDGRGEVPFENLIVNGLLQTSRPFAHPTRSVHDWAKLDAMETLINKMLLPPSSGSSMV
jgi:hypothetical protein